MKTTPGLAAFDLDGTLLNSQSEVSAYTRSTLGTLCETGTGKGSAECRFVVATGRGYKSACARLRSLEPIRWLICDNGASLYDFEDDSLVSAATMASETVTTYLADVSERLPDLTLSWSSVSNGPAWTREFADLLNVDPSRQALIEPGEQPPADCLKVLLTHPTIPGMDLLELVSDMPTHGLSVTTSGLTFIEITAPGINKSVRLAELCDRLGVDQQATIAFGDAMNDHAMLQWVGTGYAMANAHPSVKDAADAVTERTNDDDGVAHTLQAIFGS